MRLRVGKFALAHLVRDAMVLPLRPVDHLVAARVPMFEPMIVAFAGDTGCGDGECCQAEQDQAVDAGGKAHGNFLGEREHDRSSVCWERAPGGRVDRARGAHDACSVWLRLTGPHSHVQPLA